MIIPPQESERLKQPLNVLLGSLVGGNIAVHTCVIVFVYNNLVSFASKSSWFLFYYVLLEVLLFTMRTSVTSHLWLNVFYYCQIVPPRCFFFIWLKKNIKVFVYSALVMDRVFFSSSFISNLFYYSELDRLCYSVAEANSSLTCTKQNAKDSRLLVLSEIFMINYWLRLAYYLIRLCMMSASSCATILYLRRHMKSMEEGSSSFSSPRLQKQMRVTITGVIQAIFYFICSTWVICDGPLRMKLPNFDPERYIYCSVISLYTLCSTLILAIGQTIFRQRIVHFWQNLVEMTD
ncbi:taste receptor, type 2, member 201, tandem duplicate 1 [Hoplias malabaricus]|uniref:taste receptor, type 2, member 201, tandem duplicate 1 n=1 Tax=Hoplias malabaricus TaxID=27720 RepID=UPI0034624724